MSHSENMNYLGNHNYPVNINDHAYKSCSNDEYDALESNVPYISKNRPYSPKAKLYHSVNNWDILAFIVVTTLLVLLLFTTTQINNQKNMTTYPDNGPASIYENYNHIGDDIVDHEFRDINSRNLHDNYQNVYHTDLSDLYHKDELNDAPHYYSEYYKTRLQELCDLSLKKANKSSNKENKKIN